MKFKIKREYIILGVILILLVGYLIFKNSNKTNYKLPSINKIKKDDVIKVALLKSNKTVVIQKENDKWYIIPEKYPVNGTKIDDMLKILTDLTITDLVSESKNYALYELDDEKKVNVKAYSKDDKIIREFEIGKTASTYNHTFIKLVDNPNVYYAKEDFKSKFDVKADDLRDKTVMKFDLKQITSMTMNNTKEKFAINKTSNNTDIKIDSKNSSSSSSSKSSETPSKDVWKTDAGIEVNDDEVSDILETLSNLNCENYINNKTKKDYNFPIYSLTLKGTKEYTILIFKKDGESYPAISSENDFPFLLTSWKAEKMMKKYDVFFKKK